MTTGAPVVGVSLAALGVQVRIDAEQDLAARLRRAWACCLSEHDGTPAVVVDVRELRSRIGGGSEDQLLERVTQEVTLRAISARAGKLLMLHACAVADPATGRVVVCAGRSGMGKTTLASVLGRRWGYVTDETVALEDSGAVLSYPKPLSLRGPADATKQQVAPAELGLTPTSGPLQVAAVVLLDRRPDAAQAQVSPVPNVPAVALLAEHTSYLARLDRPLSRVADLVHRTGGLRRVTYGEAAQLESVVDDLMRAPA